MTDQTNQPDPKAAPTTTPNPTTTPATPPVQPSGGTTGGDGDNPAWLPARLDRAREQARKELLKDLGVESPDELKTFLAEARKAKEAQMSETEKAKAELDKLTKRATEAEAKAQAVEAKRVASLVDTALVMAAKDARAEHPEDVVKFLRDGSADAVKALLKDDETIDDKAMKALIDAAKKARPGWFLTGGPGSPSNRSGHAPDPSDAAKKKLAETKLFHL